MILQWFNFLLDVPSEIISFLQDSFVFPNVSLLSVLVVVAVAGIITGTFLSVARR